MGQVQVLNYKLFLIVFGIVLLLSLVSAVQTYPLGQNIEIKHAIRLNGAVPPVNTNCNFTLYHFNKTALINFQPMTNASSYFNYTINTSQITQKGTYDYDITCVSGSENVTATRSILVNLGGVEPTDQRTNTLTRTIWIFFILAVLCFVGLLYFQTMPVRATLFLFMVWFILIGLNTSFIAIQDEVVNTTIEGFFSFFLTISYYANYAIFFFIIVIWVMTFFANIFNFQQRKKQQRYGTYE